jgi:hypothetical protein
MGSSWLLSEPAGVKYALLGIGHRVWRDGRSGERGKTTKGSRQLAAGSKLIRELEN